MFLLSRDNRTGKTFVHYLPERKVLRAGRPSLLDSPDITIEVLPTDILIQREGNTVIVQLPNEKYVLEAPGSINLTDVLLSFVPISHILQRVKGAPVTEVVHDLEHVIYNEPLPEDVRKFLRLYASILALDNIHSVPENVREDLYLTVSRLTGEPLEHVVSRTEEVREKILKEMGETLKKMDPSEMLHILNVMRVE